MTRAATTQTTKAGIITAATTAQVDSGARAWPAVGSPAVTMTATAPASKIAHIHSRAVIRC
ncbi:hypothetical protein MULP_02149 [Mycobacterium liflandii 128FXT]|uniref:Uncharacterized protein n=2 Tax=Mycobacterium ulcerans group TaxID=2993898 RepID=A0A9N7QMC5_9MYCO|nr:hypothetical protein MULP_02149 [Mycobacterium liflandii 128FXT]MBC9862202.1 hypothetical protein [Mycobacterium pseudoshottsii]RFZ65551.1 hypothetical protein BB170200_01248 [Mycobacterium marinum]BBA87577.1 hypothetical protein MPSD_19970 [Mycobacterium pseudoshottsii JCM 15466]RFZ71053.1 hypothetical protein DL240490_00975 [Mycobacterium marinum]